MPKQDWKFIREGKDAHRDRAAAIPFDEKISRLERLYERTLVLGLGRDATRVSTSRAVVSSPNSPSPLNTAANTTFVAIRVIGAAAPLVSAMSVQSGSSANFDRNR